MARRTDITVDQLQDWFKIGKEITKIEIQGSSTGGFGLSQKKSSEDFVDPVPLVNRRFAREHPYDYVEHFVKLEDASLTKNLTETKSRHRDGDSNSQLYQLDVDSFAGTIPDIHELDEEDLTQVYSNYNFCHTYNSRLQVSKYKEDIINAIETQQVLIVEGATGSGKTTQVPQFILDHYATKGQHCNIIVTQPRRIAAMSVARRVCQERKWELGGIVGYQVGMDRKSSLDTRLCYVTTGVLLQKLINNKDMNSFTHVILDEVHERDQDMDFCLLVVRKFLRTVSKNVKVILMSATFDVSLFGKYFCMPLNGRLEPAMTVSMEGKGYSIGEYWITDLRQLGPVPELDPAVPCIPEESYYIAVKLITHLDRMEIQEQDKEVNGFAPNRGCVLIFLPGLEEIQTMDRMLSPQATDRRWWIVPLHSTITTEEQSRAFQAAQPGYRKIILSTNIAESSITVPDIKIVIDFCLTKSLVCDTETNYTSLQLEWASKANCKQRRGRTGRVAPGRVYRMISEKFYDTILPEFNIAEMKRCPLEQIVLRVKLLDMGEPKALLALALEPPNLGDIQRTIRTLKEVGALSTMAQGSFNPDDGDLTFMGRVLAKLPVDIHIGKLIVLGFVFGFLEECVIIGAGLSLKSIFAHPMRGDLLEAYKTKVSWADGTYSDCLAVLHAYTIWQTNMRTKKFEKPGGLTMREWCHRNHLQLRRLKDLENLIKELGSRLDHLNIRKPTRAQRSVGENEKNLILKVILCGAFYPNYFNRGEPDEQDVVRTLGGHNPSTTVLLSGFPPNQGILYKLAVEDMFRKIGKIQIHFEDSKAFVEFLKNQAVQEQSEMSKSRKTEKIMPAVYLSIKMRLLRTSFELRLLTNEEADKRMHSLEARAAQQSGNDRRLRSNRMSTGPMALTPVPPVQLPPLTVTTVYLYVTHVINCGHFWAHSATDEVFQEMRRLQEDINSDIDKLQPVMGSLTPGQVLLAPYTEQGSTCYYRGRVEAIRGAQVVIFFVDFGNTESVPRDSLRQLDRNQLSDMITFPMQSFECILSELRPSSVKCTDGVWTEEAKHAFVDKVYGKKCYGRVYSVVQNVVRLELIRQTDQGQEFSINEYLKNGGFAENAEESFLSKQNNQLREKAKYFNSLVGDSNDAHQGQENWYPNDTQLDSTSSAQVFSSRKIRLKGPYSPLEIKYYNSTKAGIMRPVRIEQDSVNCAILDPEPQDKCTRMMVAASVGLNPSGNTLVARDTTLMPNIHGLPQIMALLFAPFAELRTDPKFTRYTGALCGLGYDLTSAYSLYPEHDMEVMFDAHFDQQDLVNINVVRMCIALSLKSVTNYVQWDDARVEKFQREACKTVLNLIRRQRELIEPKNFMGFHKWKRIPANRIEPGSCDDSDMDPTCLQMLHSAVRLDVNLEAMSRHITELHTKASKSLQREDIICKLCQITVRSPQELLFHLKSSVHVEKEKRLYNIDDDDDY